MQIWEHANIYKDKYIQIKYSNILHHQILGHIDLVLFYKFNIILNTNLIIILSAP